MSKNETEQYREILLEQIRRGNAEYIRKMYLKSLALARIEKKDR